ncbi:MAG: hypothetical protein EHM32_11145 [Spirochaetales bacterium]|nr:MAG: hypothetical protein EHM32_11145 [Spirochaetales bacterium]
MKEINAEAVMSAEIRRRLNDDGWNFEMAGKVLARRRKTVRFRALTGAFSGAALAAALVFFVVLPDRVDTGNGVMYNFVSAQVDGAYDDVFATGVKPEAEAEFATLDATDAFIDSVMVER